MNFTSDLDGTLSNEQIADIIDRWDDYESQSKELLKFTPKKGVEVLSEYNLSPIIITGRREGLRNATELWLHQNHIPFKELVMMPNEPFEWGNYIRFKLDEHRKRDIKFALEDNKLVATVLNNDALPTFLVEDDFSKTLAQAIRTILKKN